jgi:hypothetical protein
MDGVIDAVRQQRHPLYGDFQKFQIVDRVGMSVEFIPHLFGANGRPDRPAGLVRLLAQRLGRAGRQRVPPPRRVVDARRNAQRRGPLVGLAPPRVTPPPRS